MTPPRWSEHVPPDASGDGDARTATCHRSALPLDARLCAVIAGFAVAALLCLGFGDALAAWAGVR